MYHVCTPVLFRLALSSRFHDVGCVYPHKLAAKKKSCGRRWPASSGTRVVVVAIAPSTRRSRPRPRRRRRPMFLLGLPTFEARTPSLERHVAAADVGHVQSHALVQLSLDESGGGYSDARAAIVDEGTQDRVGGKSCGTYLIVSMERSASSTLCHDVNLIDGHTFRCAFELFGIGHSLRHHYDQDWVRGHPKEFLRHVANQSRTLKDACVWGFKLFDQQLANVEPIISEVDKCIIYRCAGRAL